MTNALRVEHEPGGPANIPEFGTTKTEAGFRALQEMDAVEHVRPGVRYPATLLTAGVHDSRVEAWQPAKMTAVLQERSTSGYPVLLRVGFDAGHGMGLTKQQRVEEMADTYAFLLWQLQGAGGTGVPVRLASASLVNGGFTPALSNAMSSQDGRHSIRINEQYRICFRWADDGVHDVEITDYH